MSNDQTKVLTAPLTAEQKKAAKTRAFKKALFKEFEKMGARYQREGVTHTPQSPIYKKLQLAAEIDKINRPSDCKKALRFHYQVKFGGTILVRYRVGLFGRIVIVPPKSLYYAWAALGFE